MTELTAKAEMPTPTTQLVPTRTGTDRRKDILRLLRSAFKTTDNHGDAEDNLSNIATIANVLLAKSYQLHLMPFDVAR